MREHRFCHRNLDRVKSCNCTDKRNHILSVLKLKVEIILVALTLYSAKL